MRQFFPTKRNSLLKSRRVRVESSFLLSGATTSCTTLLGLAKPMSPAKGMPRVFTPMISPLRLTSGPPELPGAMAASC